jgi:hypothetical protein
MFYIICRHGALIAGGDSDGGSALRSISISYRYLLVALVVTCFYSLLTALASLKLISGSSPATRTLFLLVLLDVVSTFFIIYSN